MPAVIIIAFVGFVIFAIVAGHMQTRRRREELRAWASRRAFSFDTRKRTQPEPWHSMFGVLRQGSNRYAYNIMSGNAGDRTITCFDYHYQTESRDSKGNRQVHHHHFSATIVTPTLFLKPLTIRPEGFFDRIKGFFGYDDIDFESNEFSQQFHVTASDRKWAFDVLHQETIEFLMSRTPFTIQMQPAAVLATHRGKMAVQEFDESIAVIAGILDRLPQSVVRELLETQS